MEQRGEGRARTIMSIIGSYFVDIVFNHIYISAKNSATKANLREDYRDQLVSFATGVKIDKDCYRDTINRLHMYYREVTVFSAIPYSDFVDHIVRTFIPQEYFRDLQVADKDIIVNKIICDLVSSLVTYTLNVEILNEVVVMHAEHHLTTIKTLQEYSVSVLNGVRDDVINKFFRQKVGEGKIPAGSIDEIKQVLKKTVLEKAKMEAKLKKQTELIKLLLLRVEKLQKREKKFRMLVQELKNTTDVTPVSADIENLRGEFDLTNVINEVERIGEDIENEDDSVVPPPRPKGKPKSAAEAKPKSAVGVKPKSAAGVKPKSATDARLKPATDIEPPVTLKRVTFDTEPETVEFSDLTDADRDEDDYEGTAEFTGEVSSSDEDDGATEPNGTTGEITSLDEDDMLALNEFVSEVEESASGMVNDEQEYEMRREEERRRQEDEMRREEEHRRQDKERRRQEEERRRQEDEMRREEEQRRQEEESAVKPGKNSKSKRASIRIRKNTEKKQRAAAGVTGGNRKRNAAGVTAATTGDTGNNTGIATGSNTTKNSSDDEIDIDDLEFDDEDLFGELVSIGGKH